MRQVVMVLLALLASGVSAQTSITPGGSSGSSTITNGSTATSGCVAGGVLRSISNMVDCGAGLTYESGSLINTGSSRFGDASLGSTTVPLTARLGTGSTANVFEMQNSAGTVLSYFNSAGTLNVPNTVNLGVSGDGIYGASYVTALKVGPLGHAFSCQSNTTPGCAVLNSLYLGWTSASNAAADTFFSREAAATIQLGGDVNGSAVNQTIKSHDGITGTNISGADLTIAAGRGTGTGSGGVLKFQTAPVEASGTTAQTSQTRVTIQKDGGVTFAPILFANLGSPADGTLFFCSDCTIASPCAGSGTGALAKRLNSTWVCN